MNPASKIQSKPPATHSPVVKPSGKSLKEAATTSAHRTLEDMVQGLLLEQQEKAKSQGLLKHQALHSQVEQKKAKRKALRKHQALTAQAGQKKTNETKRDTGTTNYRVPGSRKSPTAVKERDLLAPDKRTYNEKLRHLEYSSLTAAQKSEGLKKINLLQDIAVLSGIFRAVLGRREELSAQDLLGLHMTMTSHSGRITDEDKQKLSEAVASHDVDQYIVVLDKVLNRLEQEAQKYSDVPDGRRYGKTAAGTQREMSAPAASTEVKAVRSGETPPHSQVKPGKRETKPNAGYRNRTPKSLAMQAKQVASIDKAISTLQILVNNFTKPVMTLEDISAMVDYIGDRFDTEEKALLTKFYDEGKAPAILAKLSEKLRQLEDLKADMAKAQMPPKTQVTADAGVLSSAP